MEFTKNFPKEPGFYWFLDKSENKLDIIEIDEHGSMWVMGYDVDYSADDVRIMDWWFGEKIEPPNL